MERSLFLTNLKMRLNQMFVSMGAKAFATGVVLLVSISAAQGAENVMLTGVPDYAWHAGCFGTAAGNLMGYWDRHGFPNFYTGPTAEGLAPLNSAGINVGVQSMWASKAGFDGRPNDQLGHIDDYWIRYNHSADMSYESTDPDPYLAAGRPEHAPDCIGDFIGSSQNKWTEMNGECNGNIDGFAFTFWDSTGNRRINYVPPPQDNLVVRDTPSGLRAWTQYRGNDGDVFSQLTDFNPSIASGHGFAFDDLKAEIDAGYPVMLCLQNFNEKSRSLLGMDRANPIVHGMLAYGYYIADSGTRYVRYKTSWGSSGDTRIRAWTPAEWEAFLPVRGVIGFHPLPQITSITRNQDKLLIKWDGPSSTLTNLITGTSTDLHWYVVEQSPGVQSTSFRAIAEPTTTHEATITNCCENSTYFRVRLVGQ